MEERVFSCQEVEQILSQLQFSNGEVLAQQLRDKLQVQQAVNEMRVAEAREELQLLRVLSE